MHDAATELEINHSFVGISFPGPLIPISDTIVKDLCTDETYSYRITQA